MSGPPAREGKRKLVKVGDAGLREKGQHSWDGAKRRHLEAPAEAALPLGASVPRAAPVTVVDLTSSRSTTELAPRQRTSGR
eukprot:scaffold7830_cov376-Prasinococcus_capsulatus_cf.AAC.1